MKPKYGLDPDTWQQAKTELLDILVETAKAGALITYGGCCERLQAVHAHPGSYVFTALLREVCRDEWDRHGVMLCALVVQKATGRPGGGYFAGMPCDQDDPLDCWRADCEAVYTFYAES